MSLVGLFDLLKGRVPYASTVEAAKSGGKAQPLLVTESAKPYSIAALWHHLGTAALVIVPRPEDARHLHDQLLTYLGDDQPVYLFSEPGVLPFERLMADAATNNQRLSVLSALQGTPATGRLGLEQDRQPPLVIASAAAALRKTPTPEVLTGAWHTLRLGSKVRLAELFAKWVSLGYRREDSVEVPGSFSYRGGIVDIFPPSSHLPARLELWGDEVESIRLFDPNSQRSVTNVDEVNVIPARETLPSLADPEQVSHLIAKMDFTNCKPNVKEEMQEELANLFSGREIDDLPIYNGLLNRGCLIDYLPQDGLLVLDQQVVIESEVTELIERADLLKAAREKRGELPTGFPSPQLSWDEFSLAMGPFPRVLLETWGPGEDSIGFQPAPSYFGKANEFAEDALPFIKEGKRIVVVSRNTRRLAELLAEAGVGTTVLTSLDVLPSPGSLVLVSGTLKEGWTLPTEGIDLTLMTDAELFGTAKERRSRLKTPIKQQAYISELAPGEHVVHVDHGVARFAGSIQMGADGEQKEYLVLEYAEGDKLYVPTDHLDRVSPYMASNDRAPNLTRLGTQEWIRLKERVKTAAKEMAKELLDLYASRQVAQGYAFSPDSPWQQELEDSFPYEETADQERTIHEMKLEMEQPHPMDRLVCGDVGYGKTEVALRAAFKAVNDGKQVALLVPTTVLAQQHYVTFSERLSPFPIKVEVLSRFRTRKEQKEVIEEIELGTADVVIGTHRLLQKDVRFKNLGLVVVDEEQRFGVGHKERFKRMRKEVDMLTLSATPIPRTLYMGLSGIRDMSTMETPPEERLPVKTYVSEYNDDVVKEAILRELERGGQVFFLHNRVKTIRRVAHDLQRLVPDARFATGHGRMAESELEEVMLSFSQGDVDVLVCTTIIESGLDIPNANTLIIDRADHFGLSQLYQLRGRVGRGSNRAYTYLLIPPRRQITKAAGKRLKAILEASELGAGFRIAMRDLEIRGAGNILGAQQSGHIHAVGFELYHNLLNEAVAEIKANTTSTAPVHPVQSVVEPRVTLPLAAHIPEAYISHLPTRLAIYQRLTKIMDRQQVDDIRDELRDRFGPLPEVVENLLYLVVLKGLASKVEVESIVRSGNTVTFTLVEPVGSAKIALEKALGSHIRVGNRQLHVDILGFGEGWKEELVESLEKLQQFRDRLPSEVGV